MEVSYSKLCLIHILHVERHLSIRKGYFETNILLEKAAVATDRFDGAKLIKAMQFELEKEQGGKTLWIPEIPKQFSQKTIYLGEMMVVKFIIQDQVRAFARRSKVVNIFLKDMEQLFGVRKRDEWESRWEVKMEHFFKQWKGPVVLENKANLVILKGVKEKSARLKMLLGGETIPCCSPCYQEGSYGHDRTDYI
jgi:hypothetical protein